MKITDRKGVPDLQLGGPPPEVEPPVEQAVQPKAASGDRVNVSDVARVLASLSSGVGGDEVRTEKVNALREQIASGRYRIDLEAVARSFLSEVLVK